MAKKNNSANKEISTVSSRYNFRKTKNVNYSLVKRRKNSRISCEIKTEFDDLHYSSLNYSESPVNNCQQLMVVETDVLKASYSLQNNSLNNLIEGSKCAWSNDLINGQDNIIIQNKDFRCSELNVKKELIEFCNNSSSTDSSNGNFIVKIKQEPLSPSSSSFLIDKTEDINFEVKNELLDFESSSEHTIATSDSCLPNMEDCLEMSTVMDLSVSIKKEVMDEASTDTIVSDSECLSDNSKTNFYKIKDALANIKMENVDNVLTDSNLLNSDSTTEGETVPSTKYNMKYINPFCFLKKKVIVKKEKLCKTEKETIELEKDRRCENISRQTGQKWSRAQINDESSIKNSTVSKLPDVITVFTPAGQKCELYPNFDRPEEFPKEADCKRWDAATAVNISRNIWEIENGYFIPLGVDIKKEESFQSLKDKVEEVYQITPPLLSDFLFLTAENMFLKLDCWIKTRLPDKEDDVSTLMNQVIGLKFNQFLFIKHPQVLTTLIKVMKQDKYPILRLKSSSIYKKIQVTFDLTDSDKFNDYVFGLAQKFRSSCGNMSLIEYMMLTPESVDIICEDLLTDISRETEPVDPNMRSKALTNGEVANFKTVY